ncbi:polyprenyl synthetase family protein [Candidatus Micrarchaeota archaeon]|nr:polyprenyl synthetase family protein [Candidatus Micrarchaeota archaeon]
MALYSHIKPYLNDIESIMQLELRREDERIYGMLPAFLKRGGKRIRPALALLSCGAVGGHYTSVIEPAVVLELFHNFTLIHDDIEDNSQFRRGEPALHITHGLPIALNSGDALYTFLWKKLINLHLESSELVELQKLCADSFKCVVDGQGVELSWAKESKFHITEKEYYEMINGKTSALIGLACEMGAFIGGAGEPERIALREYGKRIGTAFQIQDDVLNLTGDFEKYKKEIGGDISEGKRTLIVVHFLSKANNTDKNKLISILSSHSTKKADIDLAIQLLGKHGSIEYAHHHACTLVEEAKSYLEILSPSKDKDTLIAVADYVVNRES